MAAKIGEILLRLGYVSDEDIRRALETQRAEGGKRKLGEILTEMFISQDSLLHALTVQERSGPSDPGLDIVSQILRHRLKQADIRRMLSDLSTRGPDTFIELVSDILERTASFLGISGRLSGILSLEDLLATLVGMVKDSLGADRATLFLDDPETSELYSLVLSGSDDRRTVSEIRFPNHLGIAGAVFATGKPAVIDDAYQDPRFNPEVDRKSGYRTRSILCAPVTTGEGRRIGVIQVLNKHEGAFTGDDLTLLSAMCSQASSALVNAQLFDQVQRARAEEGRLLEVTTAISKELHLEPLLHMIMKTTTEMLDADRSTLFMHDERTDELWSIVAQGAGTREIRFPAHLGIAGSVLKGRRTVNIPDAYQDARFNPEVDRKTGYRTRSILCMPVINKEDRAIGVIQALNKRGGPFTAPDERKLQAFSAQASIAIENAKLFDEVLEMKNYNEGILESMGSGIVTLDAAGRIIKCNSASVRMLALGAVAGAHAREVFKGPNEWVYAGVENVLHSGEQYIAMDTEYALPGDGAGPVSVNLSVVPLKNLAGVQMGTMLVFEDITEEKRLKGTMARYLTKEVAERLLESGEAALGGQLSMATVLFSDIRNFTSLSEKLGATGTVQMLNDYFGLMVDILFRHQGVLDKYIGDAILAVFGAPFSTGRDEDNAVQAAVDMLRELRSFNALRTIRGLDEIRIGVGINSDEVLTGNIGSLKRMDYTVIGDGVNLASRLEGATKFYQCGILVSEFTFHRLGSEYVYREVDRIRVKGKSEPVGVFAILDHHDETSFPRLLEVVDCYNRAVKGYKRRDWAQAGRLFEEALGMNPRDGLSRMYLERCRVFMNEPPEDDWDGVWEMKTK